MGGGGNTFTGWTIATQLDTTANGTIHTTTVVHRLVTIVGTGTEKNDAGLNIQAHCNSYTY